MKKEKIKVYYYDECDFSDGIKPDKKYGFIAYDNRYDEYIYLPKELSRIIMESMREKQVDPTVTKERELKFKTEVKEGMKQLCDNCVNREFFRLRTLIRKYLIALQERKGE